MRLAAFRSMSVIRKRVFIRSMEKEDMSDRKLLARTTEIANGKRVKKKSTNSAKGVRTVNGW